MKRLSQLTQELALALEVASRAQAWGVNSPFQQKINELLVKAGRKPVLLLRVRFRANIKDPRPVNWPVKHPYWITGEGQDYATVVSYADDENYILTNWPEATNLETQEVEGYTFTDRFPKPDWFEKGKK